MRPWVRAAELAEYLNARKIEGVRFVPVSFTPTASNYAHQQCNGVNLLLTNRETLDAPELGIELAAALRKLYPQQFDISHMNQLLVDQAAFDALQAGEDPHRIADDWRDGLEQWKQVRAKYLMY